jgi:hypothetical protein
MKRLILLLCILSLAFITEAQINGSVKGKLLTLLQKQPLSEATVSVMLVKDSSLVSFSLSDKKGNFEIPILMLVQLFIDDLIHWLREFSKDIFNYGRKKISRSW